jgi:hypothetical protein
LSSRMEDVGLQYIYKEYGHGDITLGHVFNLNIKRIRSQRIQQRANRILP